MASGGLLAIWGVPWLVDIPLRVCLGFHTASFLPVCVCVLMSPFHKGSSHAAFGPQPTPSELLTSAVTLFPKEVLRVRTSAQERRVQFAHNKELVCERLPLGKLGQISSRRHRTVTSPSSDEEGPRHRTLASTPANGASLVSAVLVDGKR